MGVSARTKACQRRSRTALTFEILSYIHFFRSGIRVERASANLLSD
jgi:hypothetical protein